jgi:carbamate kinase
MFVHALNNTAAIVVADGGGGVPVKGVTPFNVLSVANHKSRI